MSDFNKVETKWNADDQKLQILMQLETSLEEAFLTFDFDSIYYLLRGYRRHTAPKFGADDRKTIAEELDKLSLILLEYKKYKTEELKNKFYLGAEDFFLTISQALKEAGVYYREGRDASKAILMR